jgi:protein-L-isoaspartate(D-aspartate) O-methyltransferase
VLLTSMWLGAGCVGVGLDRPMPDQPGTQAIGDDAFARRRAIMVETQIAARGVADPAVLAAMRKVPRHRFVPPSLVDDAYVDGPLPIGFQQTISQPYIVAYMSEALRVSRQHKVLEIGTGSGYQAAVLGELASQVYTIEIIPELGERARALLAELGYQNVHVRTGDGYLGWPEQAPFDRIMVTAAPDHVPPPLVDQLAIGGHLVIPVGRWEQEMTIVTKTERGVVTRVTIPVRFVPLTRRPQV